MMSNITSVNYSFTKAKYTYCYRSIILSINK